MAHPGAHRVRLFPWRENFLRASCGELFIPRTDSLHRGLDGWGDYSTQDGFHRVRYLGGKVRNPIGFKAHENGIRIDFAVELDAKTGQDAGHFFAQQWNYEYGKRYGSPEFSVNTPDSLGHDPVPVRSVKLLENKKSIFVEMPALKPVMQLYLRMKLRDGDGVEFSADLFSSPMYPHPPYSADGLAKVVTMNRDIGALRTQNTQPKKKPTGPARLPKGPGKF